ncbi:protein kinase domain-containing protein [Lysinibacillus fusiformis]|uniref:protein kinase domain-containing protein n=1 Tax=Lysinibacillus fusiformis TaxID=28031 RepID=UPI00365D73E6
MSDINRYLKNKLDEFNQNFMNNDEYVLYEYLYDSIDPDELEELFPRIHSALNRLLKFLNEKHNNFDGGHYNAAESRQLIYILDFLRMLKANLYKFKVEISLSDYYQKRLEECTSFLSSSGGSKIPKEFEKVLLIESEAIFKLANQITVEQNNKLKSLTLKPVGEGAYAKVYKYKDPSTNQWIALKKANKDLTADELIRFKLEFDSIKKLDSPFIVKSYKYDEQEISYSMEYIDEVLEDYIGKRNNKLIFEKRNILIVQLLNGFEYLHSKSMLHRDISYRNILVKTYDDGTDMIKISDLGLVKIKESNLTKENTIVKGSINDLTDLERIGFKNYIINHETYALTKVIYFILTGRKSNYELENNRGLREFLDKGLHSQRENRFNSIEEIRKFLKMKVYPNLKKELQSN